MSTGLSADLAARARINATIMEYFRPGAIWTPAMGALLVSGVLPIAGCTEIPTHASQLANSTLPATASQLTRAREVLENWIEAGADCAPYECHEKSMPPIMPFLLWCEDWYEGDPEHRKPEALSYFMSLMQPSTGTGLPTPAPLDLVERAIDLDRHAAVEKERSIPPPPAVDAMPISELSTSWWFRKRVDKLIAEGTIKAYMAPVIAEALDELGITALHQPARVWIEICKIYESKKYSAVLQKNKDLPESKRDHSVDVDALVAVVGKGKWRA